MASDGFQQQQQQQQQQLQFQPQPQVQQQVVQQQVVHQPGVPNWVTNPEFFPGSPQASSIRGNSIAAFIFGLIALIAQSVYTSQVIPSEYDQLGVPGFWVGPFAMVTAVVGIIAAKSHKKHELIVAAMVLAILSAILSWAIVIPAIISLRDAGYVIGSTSWLYGRVLDTFATALALWFVSQAMLLISGFTIMGCSISVAVTTGRVACNKVQVSTPGLQFVSTTQYPQPMTAGGAPLQYYPTTGMAAPGVAVAGQTGVGYAPQPPAPMGYTQQPPEYGMKNAA